MVGFTEIKHVSLNFYLLLLLTCLLKEISFQKLSFEYLGQGLGQNALRSGSTPERLLTYNNIDIDIYQDLRFKLTFLLRIQC